MPEHVTLFDKPYSDEKIAEGLAVAKCVANRACVWCAWLLQCAEDEHFTFPEDAPCTKEKEKILRDWKNKEETENG